MESFDLGFTGEKVSALCLGTMYFASKTDEQTSIDQLDMYIEAGGTFLDTSNAYARWVPGCIGGESETLLGTWMQDSGNRDNLFIATKVGFPVPRDEIEFGLSEGQIIEACEKSLQRLKTDRIDLYYAHNDPRNTPMEERMGAFAKLVKAGKVRYIGASNYMDWRLEEARCVSLSTDSPQFCCIQQRYSYVRPQAGAVYDPHVVANDELIDYVKNRNMTILAYSPLLGGAYVRDDKEFPTEYSGPDLDVRLAALKQVADSCNATVHQVVLAWLLRSHPAVIPIIAASTTEQLKENIGSLEVDLDAEALHTLSQAGNIRQQNPLGQRTIVPGMKEG